jgi:hypothetical protein
MQLRPQLQIQTIIKAMMEDVIPALDHTNQLAMQSAQLTIGTLTLLAQHLPLEYRYDCDELTRLVVSAHELAQQAQGGERTNAAVAVLKEAQRIGGQVLDRARAEPDEVVQAVRALRSATANIVRAVHAEGNEAAQAQVDSTVMAMSKEQLLRERSWLLMQGWEPDPKSVPAIDTLLAPLDKG